MEVSNKYAFAFVNSEDEYLTLNVEFSKYLDEHLNDNFLSLREYITRYIAIKYRGHEIHPNNIVFLFKLSSDEPNIDITISEEPSFYTEYAFEPEDFLLTLTNNNNDDNNNDNNDNDDNNNDFYSKRNLSKYKNLFII